MRQKEPSAVKAALSRNLKGLRLAQSLTQDALAARAGISKGMLVQVEQARTNPSLATLCHLANALSVSLPELLDASPLATISVRNRDDSVVLWKGKLGGEGRLLAASYEPCPLELWEFRLAPGDVHRAGPQPHGTLEMVHIVTGRLALRVGEESVEARAGETVIFRPDRDHEYRNAGRNWLHMTITNVGRLRS